MVDAENDSTMVRTLPLPLNYLQEAPLVPAKTQREMALGAARERGQSPNVESAGDRSQSSASTGRLVTGGNVDDASDRPVSPEVLCLRYDVDSLRRIIVQAFQPNDWTEPPPEYNEEPRP